ncbi:MAG: arginine deiminase-related protein [Bacteroidota bacterium]|nr:arginine deiminase-related protein [Bacteroidota bacterium]
MQNTSHLLMIRPAHFGYNVQTAANNSFQIKGDQTGVSESALREFDDLVSKLQTHEIDVTVVEDSPEPHTPDAIFPNNWISFHDQQTLCLYPMYAPNRRQERKPAVLESIIKKFSVKKQIDLTHYENSLHFLEGTGSMVLDRDNRIAYAGISPRTDRLVLEDFCRQLNYQPCVFHATDERGKPVYHTNVMMCVGDRFVVICLDSVRDAEEKKSVSDRILRTGKEIIPISLQQMNHFAGNMLQVENVHGEKFLIMSSAAYYSLSSAQIEKLSAFSRIIHSALHTIETNGGGSARCMIAEIYPGN